MSITWKLVWNWYTSRVLQILQHSDCAALSELQITFNTLYIYIFTNTITMHIMDSQCTSLISLAPPPKKEENYLGTEMPIQQWNITATVTQSLFIKVNRLERTTSIYRHSRRRILHHHHSPSTLFLHGTSRLTADQWDLGGKQERCNEIFSYKWQREEKYNNFYVFFYVHTVHIE